MRQENKDIRLGFIRCTECGMKLNQENCTEDFAIDLWNTRKPVEKVVEQMIDLEKQKENFKNHIATFTDYGNIKILDFMEPNTSHYRIRFLFEEDYCRLHISGDLGELIATNYSNMTYEKFSDFVNNVGYFEGKIDCHSRKIYVYDEECAKNDIKKRSEEYDCVESILHHNRYDWETDEDKWNEFFEEVFEDFSEDNGIGSKGYDALSEYMDDDVWEFAGNIGRRETGILELYMLAFKLAQEQLKAGGTDE